VKDSVLNLLVFLLVFVAVAATFLGAYGISLILVPGGKGLIFASPYAAALLPALLAALLTAQFRTVRRPGLFQVTWALLAAAFFLLLTLSIPQLEKMPPVRAADATPLVPNRFLPLADGSLLLTSGKATVQVPPNGALMTVSAETQFDAFNQRFVFSTGEPKALGSTGPEQAYYQYTPALAAVQTDLLGVYLVLRGSSAEHPILFWFQAWAVTWLFLGLFFFFSLRTWPLVHVVLILLLMRLALVFVVYAFWTLPVLVDNWTPVATAVWLRLWAPVVLLDVAAASLFFMTWLSKPWQREALS